MLPCAIRLKTVELGLGTILLETVSVQSAVKLFAERSFERVHIGHSISLPLTKSAVLSKEFAFPSFDWRPSLRL